MIELQVAEMVEVLPHSTATATSFSAFQNPTWVCSETIIRWLPTGTWTVGHSSKPLDLHSLC